MKKEKTIDFHIKWAWHSISRMYNVYAGQNDMTMSIGYVLINIDSENGTPATKIGPSIGMEPRSLTRMLKALEEKGWIYRETDETDKRYVKVFLTEEGKRKRRFARKGVISFNEKIYNQIPKEKIDTFVEVLEELKSIVEDETANTRANLATLKELAEIGY